MCYATKLLTRFTSIKLSVQSYMQTLNVILGVRIWKRARHAAREMMMINQAATGVNCDSV